MFQMEKNETEIHDQKFENAIPSFLSDSKWWRLTCSDRGHTIRVHGTSEDTADRCKYHPEPTRPAPDSNSGSTGSASHSTYSQKTEWNQKTL